MLLVLSMLTGIVNAKDLIKILVLTGQNNYNREAGSVILQKDLNKSGIFAAGFAISPKTGENRSSFGPCFSTYKDERYDRLRGTAKNLAVLSTACSNKETGGTGRDKAVLTVMKRGKGRIFHTVLGHAGGNPAYPAVEGASSTVTLLRGAEWTATGKVIRKVPCDFPVNKL